MGPNAPAWPGGAGSFRSPGPLGTSPPNPLHTRQYSPRGTVSPGHEHGPFVHTLNKGGLQEIVASGKLRGTAPANHLAADRLAVRAYTGSFEHQKRNKNWSGKVSVHIEFMTTFAPDPDLPPGWATWSDDRLLDGHLPIRILRVVNGDGELIAIVNRLQATDHAN